MSDERRMEEYLWDPASAPDPEVERLERLLGRYRLRRGASSAPTRRWIARVAISAALVAASVLVIVFAARGPFYRVTGVDYRVSGVERSARARPGDWIEAGEQTARVEIASIGEVELDPGSRVRVEAIDLGGEEGEGALHALYLDEGALHARIVAGPRVFQVDTPAGISIDLGCEYRLEVGEDGRATIRVLTGQIAFGWQGREVYVPAGASCESIPGRGPTPPMFDDTSPERRELVLRFARGEPWTEQELEALVALESHEDALPLFAMLADPAYDLELRTALCERLEQTFQRPSNVTREGILALDRTHLAGWLDLAKDWWRTAKIGD